jgi:hypothetical protein
MGGALGPGEGDREADFECDALRVGAVLKEAEPDVLVFTRLAGGLGDL